MQTGLFSISSVTTNRFICTRMSLSYGYFYIQGLEQFYRTALIYAVKVTDSVHAMVKGKLSSFRLIFSFIWTFDIGV